MKYMNVNFQNAHMGLDLNDTKIFGVGIYEII